MTNSALLRRKSRVKQGTEGGEQTDLRCRQAVHESCIRFVFLGPLSPEAAEVVLGCSGAVKVARVEGGDDSVSGLVDMISLSPAISRGLHSRFAGTYRAPFSMYCKVLWVAAGAWRS